MAKRRKSGEGTVRQRKDGRWEGRIVVSYDEKGLPKTKNVTAKQRQSAWRSWKSSKQRSVLR